MTQRTYPFLLLLCGFLLFAATNSIGQGIEGYSIGGYYNSGHEADRWLFGDSAGLDFRGTVPIADLSNKLWINTSPAVISDPEGNLLIYSNGYRARNGLLEIMPNGDSLHGFSSITMPSLIAPKPGNDKLYYIFTIGRPTSTPPDTVTKYGLEYSVVDMELDTGMGDVNEKNVVLTEPEVSSKLTGVKHSNGTDYWIIVHMFDSDEFRAFLLTEDGINPNNFVSSHIGSFHLPPGSDNNNIGYMKLSPDGTKLALNIYGSGIIEIFDFNTSTGQVTQAITSPPVFREAYGLEFSPDSKYFYVSAISVDLPTPGYTPPSYLFQFEIAKGPEVFTEGNYDTVAQDASGSYFGGMQIGRDGRIYITRGPNGNTKVSVFQNPLRQGEACNFTLDTVSLGGRTSRYGFPNFITSYFHMPHFELDYGGASQSIQFNLRNINNIDSVLWIFGDPASSQNISREFQPIHTFTAPGTYEVRVTEYYDGMSYGPYKEIVNTNLVGISEPGPSPSRLCLIYPNPASEGLSVEVLGLGSGIDYSLVIYDMFGREVTALTPTLPQPGEGVLKVDVSSFPAGIYIAVVKSNNGEALSGKFVVQPHR